MKTKYNHPEQGLFFEAVESRNPLELYVALQPPGGYLNGSRPDNI